MKNNSDTLYLPIKQVYFDQIVVGTKFVQGLVSLSWCRAPLFPF